MKRITALTTALVALAAVVAGIAVGHSVPSEGPTIGCESATIPYGGFPQGTHIVNVKVIKDGVKIIDGPYQFTGTSGFVTALADFSGRHSFDISTSWTDDGGGVGGPWHLEGNFDCGSTTTVTNTTTTTLPASTVTVTTSTTDTKTVTVTNNVSTPAPPAVTLPAVTLPTVTVKSEPVTKTTIKLVPKIVTHTVTVVKKAKTPTCAQFNLIGKWGKCGPRGAKG
jgi:hypothetical protein